MKNNTLKWLSDVVGKHKISVLVLSLIQALLGGSGVIYALLLRNGIDSAAEKDRSGFLLALALVIILVLIQILLRAVVRWLEEHSRSTIENILKSRLFETLLKKDYASVTNIHSGEWMNRLTSDTNTYKCLLCCHSKWLYRSGLPKTMRQYRPSPKNCGYAMNRPH